MRDPLYLQTSDTMRPDASGHCKSPTMMGHDLEIIIRISSLSLQLILSEYFIIVTEKEIKTQVSHTQTHGGAENIPYLKLEKEAIRI